jgi:hypothetical protein
MERRPISEQERSALEGFLRLEVSFEQLLAELDGMIEIQFLPTQRLFTSHFELVEPPIRVGPADVDRAISAYRTGTIDDRTLVRWATMLILNDAYLWDEDDDETVDALHELSIGGIQGWERLRNPPAK